MKQWIAAGLSLTLLLGGCASSNRTANTATGKKQNLAGYWTLNQVTTSGATGNLRLTLLDDAVSTCFQGSRWMLMPNGRGSYNIGSTAAGCNAGERQIQWSVGGDANNVFQLKRLADGTRARQVETGYRMTVESSTDQEMVLATPVQLDGQTITVRYQFTRDAGR